MGKVMERLHVGYTGHTQKNGAISKVDKIILPYMDTTYTVQISYALPAVRFSCLLRGHGTCFQDGVAAGEGFMCSVLRCPDVITVQCEFRARFKKDIILV
jgi:hypothetical protein